MVILGQEKIAIDADENLSAGITANELIVNGNLTIRSSQYAISAQKIEFRSGNYNISNSDTSCGAIMSINEFILSDFQNITAPISCEIRKTVAQNSDEYYTFVDKDIDAPANSVVIEDVSIVDFNETNFPNEDFRSYVVGLQTVFDGRLSLEEIEKVTEITLKKKISDLTGIEFFTNLQKLSCSDCGVKQLDVSKNLKLHTIIAERNFLASINLGNNNLINGCQLTVNADENRQFDLTKLPNGFDISKASNWKGGAVSGNTLTFDEESNVVTYKYDTGAGKIEFALIRYYEIEINDSVFSDK